MARGSWRLIDGGAELRIRATPNAPKDAVEGLGEEASGRRYLKVRVRAVAEKGKANAAIEALLAKALELPKSAVSVEKRIKTVQLLCDISIVSALVKLTGENDGG
jgi:uncharacterized protein